MAKGGVNVGRHRDHESGMGLLPRMEARVGKKATSYRYKTIDGKQIALGTDRLNAIRQVLDLLGQAPYAGSVRYVWESYQKSARWLKLTQATREDYEQCWLQIEPLFGDGPIGSITSTMIARYILVERAQSPSRANHEKALLSNLFRHAIPLGFCTGNPA